MILLVSLIFGTNKKILCSVHESGKKIIKKQKQNVFWLLFNMRGFGRRKLGKNCDSQLCAVDGVPCFLTWFSR